MKNPSRPLHRLGVLATVVGLLVLAGSVPRRSADMPLRIAVGLWPGSESLFLAREAGLLPDSHFIILEAAWPSVAYRAFDNGAVDAAVLTGEDLGRLLEAGKQVTMVCVMDESRGADAILALDGTERISDLRGKRIGFAPNGPGFHLIAEALEKEGVPLEDVEIVSLLQHDIPDALFRGEVSAVVAAEPWVTGIAKRGARVLMDSNALSSPICRVLVVWDKALESDRESVIKLVRSHFALVSSLSQPEGNDDLAGALRRLGVSAEEYRVVLSRINGLDQEENLRLMEGGLETMARLLGEFSPEARPGVVKPAFSGKWWDETIVKEDLP